MKTEDNINNSQPDVFSKIIKGKLENHQLPVDADCWKEIEVRMETPKKRKIAWWFWIPIGSAAVIALLFTLNPLTESPTYTAKSGHKHIQQVHIASKNVSRVKTDAILQVNTKQTNSSTDHSQKTINYENSNSKKQPISTLSISNDSIADKNLIEQTTQTNSNNEVIIAQANGQNKDSIPSTHKLREIPESLTETPAQEPISKSKNNNHWLLAASFGSGGGAPSGNTSYESVLAGVNKDIVSAVTSYTSIMAPKDFSKIIYNSPLSFGLVVRKNLDKTISLESGLVYTYLLTNFENNGMQQNNARLHLHYIGVPLNLVGLVWRNSKWDIYFSGGTMVEKGVRSVYVQNQSYLNQTITTTVSSNIAGFQWSVNGAIGTTYKIQRNIGLYFEPKLSYYFDNNQPRSIRTDTPLVLGFTAGLRYQLK